MVNIYLDYKEVQPQLKTKATTTIRVLLRQGSRAFFHRIINAKNRNATKDLFNGSNMKVISGKGRHIFKTKNMDRSFIENTFEIQAPAGKVWRVFTDPVVTGQMGGEYVTDWKVGSSFGWKGSAGNMLTNGTILQLEPGKLLKHKLYRQDNEALVTSVITYKFRDNNGFTILDTREERSSEMTEKEYQEVVEDWNAALNAVKEIAEKL